MSLVDKVGAIYQNLIKRDRERIINESAQKEEETKVDETKDGVSESAIVSTFQYNEMDILDEEIEKFINWYTDIVLNGHQGEFNMYRKPIEMRNFIEKMAAWYELRYPDYEVERAFLGTNLRDSNVNVSMFKNNSYVNELCGEDSDARILDWSEFYNKDAFLESLPLDERDLVTQAKYPTLDYGEELKIELDDEGIIKSIDSVWCVDSSKSDLVGKNIFRVLSDIEGLCENNEIMESILNTLEQIEIKNIQVAKLLDAVMYKILARGKNRIAPRRAYLFAKEFGRSVEIPMRFGADSNDPGLRSLINEYIKMGGRTNLKCFDNYYYIISPFEDLSTKTVAELLAEKNNYTFEESALHQRLVDSLSIKSQVDSIQEEQKKKKLDP